MAYFKSFPKILYRFGDNEKPAIFNNLSAYVDLFDQVVDDVSFYENYSIKNNERPDTVSYLLYNDVQYYWTFFLLNHHLRESGWPMTEQRLRIKLMESYPNITLTTYDNISTSSFIPGASVMGSRSGAEGVILRVNLNLGQVVVKQTSTTANFRAGEQLHYIENQLVADQCFISNVVEQYNSVHHYETLDGEYYDYDPLQGAPSSGVIPVTYADRFELKNIELRTIKVIKPAIIQQIAQSFTSAMVG